MNVYALFEEISDQYGISQLVGIYETQEMAFFNKSKNRRSFVCEYILNAGPVKKIKYCQENER